MLIKGIQVKEGESVEASARVSDEQYYQCPVYMTAQRGSTFVFAAQLTTVVPAAKWVLAGVALLME